MAAPTTRSHSFCKLHVIDSQINCHPLHLQMQQDNSYPLFDKTDSSTIVVALECCQSEKPFTGCARLFATVQKSSRLEDEHIHINETQCSQNTTTVQINTLMCTNQFINHYGISADDTIMARPVQIFPLTKVVTAVTSDRALAWVQSKLFSTGLLFSVCQQTVLVRQNDVFLAPFSALFAQDEEFDVGFFSEMNVVACEPVKQGRLTVNTEIVIMDQTEKNKDQMIQLGFDFDHGFQAPRKNQKISNDSYLEPFFLSDFALITKSEILPNSNTHVPNDGNTTAKTSKDQRITGALEISIIHSLPEMRSILNIGLVGNQNGFDCDIDSMVAVSGKTLSSLGLFDGSLAEIDVENIRDEQGLAAEPSGDEKKNSRPRKDGRRTVKIQVAAGDNVRDDVVYTTPGLYYNICKKAIKRGTVSPLKLIIKKSALSEETLSLESGDDLSSSWSWRGSVPYADEVHISIVNSPQYDVSMKTSQLLKQYFRIPRLVKKGDVLSISTTLDADYCAVELSEGSGCRRPVVYFRVVRLHPALPSVNTYWVDARRAALFQDGSVNSYIPATMRMLLQRDAEVLAPPGLSPLTRRLVDTLRPHLHYKRRAGDPVPAMLLLGQPGSGKQMVTKAVAAALHLHLFQVNAHDLCGDTPAASESRVKAMMARVTTYAPCILLLRNIHVFGKATDGRTEEPRTASAFHAIVRDTLAIRDKWPVLIVATTAHVKQMNADLHEGFLHQTTLGVPTEGERLEIVTEMFAGLDTIGGAINVKRIAQRTAGFVLGDLYALLGQAHRHGQSRLFKHYSAGRQAGLSYQAGLSRQEEEDLVMAGVGLTQLDFEAALDNLQSSHSDSIGAPKIPQVLWDDVGGLVSVKAEILDTIQLPLQHPELLSAGLRRSGVLLYGPPGTGKTLLAKAVATECSLNFLSVKGPELINMYVGQSEENVREVFQRARSAAPCVIFFDELDSLAPDRGRSGDSGGVMDRVVSQLLAELDGMSKVADVFVIGATNRPDLLDPALLRPGRFDKLLYLGVSTDRSCQLKVLTALTRKFVFAPGCALERVVDQCPLNMTGADFYALCSDAMLNALKRKIALLDQGEAVDESRVEVEEEDFVDALATLVPSVSVAELGRYEALQAEFCAQTSNQRPR